MRYFLAFLVTLGLIFVVIILLFQGGGEPKTPLTVKTLDSYATTDAEVQMTIAGPINANQEHRQVRVNVGRNDVTFEQINGYDGGVVNMQSYANTENAYANFLMALQHAGFTKGDPDPKARDERGFCPLGNRYIFQIRQDNRDIQRYWATSCGNPKTYQGALSLTITLFKAQVPDYGDLTQDLGL